MSQICVFFGDFMVKVLLYTDPSEIQQAYLLVTLLLPH